MENFITGYPGHEHQARAAIKSALGEEKYEFFFDKVHAHTNHISLIQLTSLHANMCMGVLVWVLISFFVSF